MAGGLAAALVFGATFDQVPSGRRPPSLATASPTPRPRPRDAVHGRVRGGHPHRDEAQPGAVLIAIALTLMVIHVALCRSPGRP
ncbi:MAG: hypothetical protein R3C32_13125 [Chloroflexota bacterium]